MIHATYPQYQIIEVNSLQDAIAIINKSNSDKAEEFERYIGHVPFTRIIYIEKVGDRYRLVVCEEIPLPLKLNLRLEEIREVRW
jgi:hypothetical protein